MRRRGSNRVRLFAVIAAAALGLVGCAQTVSGKGGLPPLAPNSTLPVVGGSSDTFDQTVKNSLSDVLDFWKLSYPKVSGGKQFPPLSGKFYSVDGFDATSEAKQNACIARKPTSVVDNAFYCRLDDSVAWDRDAKHLVPVLTKRYGDFLATMVFAHEFGHVVQKRLGIFDQDRPLISTETQADCAAGAFTAWALNLQAPHFRPTTDDLNKALLGYLQVRDSTPETTADISHGNGFDRLSAVSDGIDRGIAYCFSDDWTKRQFTERPYTTEADYQNQGNETLQQVLDARPTNQDGTGGGGLQPSLNAFWKQAAQSIGKSWTDVKIAAAAHPKCQTDTASEFGYCPDDNTVYYSEDFAKTAYNSMSELRIDQDSGNVTIVENQPGDYALGTLFVYGWGLAVRHQLFDRSLDGKDALLAAGCYAGAYSKSINLSQGSGFALSPPDMDEATTAVFTLVSSDRAFGSRDTSTLDRINSFTKGYFGGLSVC